MIEVADRPTSAKRTLEFVKVLHDQSIDLAKRLKFNKPFREDGLIVCLYGTLIEHAGTLIYLIDAEKKAGVAAVFRAFLEAYVDFVNLNKDQSYINYCYAKYHHQWAKVLRASGEGNPYLESIGKMKNREEVLKNHESELDRLKKEKFAPLGVLERFRRANMELEYKSIYNFQSCKAHNDLRALINRHLALKEDTFELVIYEEVTVEDFMAQLDSIGGLFLSATKILHERLRSGCDQELQKLEKEFEAARVGT